MLNPVKFSLTQPRVRKQALTHPIKSSLTQFTQLDQTQTYLNIQNYIKPNPYQSTRLNSTQLKLTQPSHPNTTQLNSTLYNINSAQPNTSKPNLTLTVVG